MKKIYIRPARVLFFLVLGLGIAGPQLLRAQDLAATLARLDAAAARFRSTSADFEFDSIMTDPIPDSEVQRGSVYYQRKGGSFQMGIHINQVNGRQVPRIVVVSGGVFKMYDKLQNQVTTSNRAKQYESYLILGFGASGKELAARWNLRDLGPETVGGIKTEKLELVAKDPQVLKLFPKVTIWVDTERGVSLKQVFDEGQGQSRTCVYSNIRMNQSLPGDAFTFKPAPGAQYVTR